VQGRGREGGRSGAVGCRKKDVAERVDLVPHADGSGGGALEGGVVAGREGGREGWVNGREGGRGGAGGWLKEDVAERVDRVPHADGSGGGSLEGGVVAGREGGR